MSKKNKWWFLIRKDSSIPVEAMMDMLRFDSAIVHCNPPDGYWLLSIDRNPPTEERWKSFGIRILYSVPNRPSEYAPSKWNINQ